MQVVGDFQQDTPLATAGFSIERHEATAQVVVLSVAGDLDLSSAPELKWELADIQSQGPHHVALDLSSVTFIDSTALGVLVGAQRTLDASFHLAIACSEETVLRIFELTGLDGMFTIVPTLEEALERVNGSTTAGG